MQLTTIGLDIAKNVFHLLGLNAHHRVVLRKKLSRNNLLAYMRGNKNDFNDALAIAEAASGRICGLYR